MLAPFIAELLQAREDTEEEFLLCGRVAVLIHDSVYIVDRLHPLTVKFDRLPFLAVEKEHLILRFLEREGMLQIRSSVQQANQPCLRSRCEANRRQRESCSLFPSLIQYIYNPPLTLLIQLSISGH